MECSGLVECALSNSLTHTHIHSLSHTHTFTHHTSHTHKYVHTPTVTECMSNGYITNTVIIVVVTTVLCVSRSTTMMRLTLQWSAVISVTSGFTSVSLILVLCSWWFDTVLYSGKLSREKPFTNFSLLYILAYVSLGNIYELSNS